MAVLWLHNVPKTITDEDQKYITLILESAGYSISTLSERASFEDEIQAILAVQDSSFITAPRTGLIPKNTPREPYDLFRSSKAYCGDRARYIQKALHSLGFKTRFVSIYSRHDDTPFVKRILKQDIAPYESHALVEILTSRGWIIVDTRKRWLSLTENNVPIALRDWEKARTDFVISPMIFDPVYPLMTNSFYAIYGLYSRHGLFYAPYTPYVPDINWIEFLENLKR